MHVHMYIWPTFLPSGKIVWRTVYTQILLVLSKTDQVFPLRFCILQVIKSWTRGRPGNEASSYLGSVTCTRPIFLRKLMKAQWGSLVLLSECILGKSPCTSVANSCYHHCGKFLTEMVQSIVDPCNASLCPDNSVRVYAEISLLASCYGYEA